MDAFDRAPDRERGDKMNDVRASPIHWASWDFPNGKHISVAFRNADDVSGAGWPDGPTWRPLNTHEARFGLWAWATT